MTNYYSFSIFSSSNGKQNGLRYGAFMLVRLTEMKKLILANKIPPWNFIIYHDNSFPRVFFTLASDITDHRCTFVNMGESNKLEGLLWRFRVHDRPETECYWVSDIDEPLRITDFQCIEALQRDENLSAALCVPSWHVNPIDDRKNSIDAGGFGMRRQKFDFRMEPMINQYTNEQGDLARQYCSDEFFLMNYIEPYLASHKVKRANRGVVYTVYSQKVCKPYMRMLEEDGMENIKKRRAPKRDLVIPEFRMTLRARTA